MGRVETLFDLVRVHAALKLPWLAQIKVRFCKQADAEHRKSWRQFAHTNHAAYVVCFARAAEKELTDEEILGMSAHEFGHIVGIALKYPAHLAISNPPHWEKPAEKEATRIAVKLLGFTGLRYNRRTLEELRT